MQKPNTKKSTEQDTINGINVSDSYRWLEEAGSEEVKGWTKEQNEYTLSNLKDQDFQAVSKELAENYESTEFSLFANAKGRYFYRERRPGEDQAALYVKEGLHEDPVELIDPNGMKEGGIVTIDFWKESPMGKYVAYGLSEGGDEMAALYIKDVDARSDLDDTIENCRYSSIRWLSDESGFFYTRNPRPGEVDEGEKHLYEKVYFHRLGDDPESDELVFGEGRPKDDMIYLDLSLDNRYLAIHVAQTWTENDIYLYDTKTKETRPLVENISAIFDLTFLKDKVLLHTNHEADNYRVLATSFVNLDTPIEQWEEFIPEQEHILEFIAPSASKILAHYIVNASSRVEVFNYAGKKTGSLPLPDYSSITGISTSRTEEEFFFGVSSFTFPTVMYRYAPASGEYEIIRKMDNPLNPDDYEVTQEWFESDDGTKVPMFIFYRKDAVIDTPSPAVLYSYGGFGSGMIPRFMKNWVPWFEREGIFAIANIRGGNEFGEEWHKAGIKENKQNSFNDFMSATEHLIEREYTTSEQIGILGGSNGGLLVSAVAVQKPELFKAVASLVPLTDMVRFPKFGIAMRWVHEYGDPQVKEDLENILKWSPYHNVKEGVKYPNFLFTTAEKDTRVDPLHARKMAAALQSVEGENDIFIFTDTEAGHGPGKPIRKIVESQALILNFFIKKLGLKI